jgi:hypothetical protein
MACSGSGRSASKPFPSPAINAGDLSAIAGMSGVPEFDQRGMPFSRVFNGRIDIGAVESQPIPPAVFGDYNVDSAVDAADYVLWRNSFGSAVPPFSGADGSGNGLVDEPDYQVWRRHFGKTLPAPEPLVAAAAAIASALPFDSRHAPQSRKEPVTSSAAAEALFALFMSEPQSPDVARRVFTPPTLLHLHNSDDQDLLLVVGSKLHNTDQMPLSTAAIDAALSDEDDRVECAQPLAVTLGCL